MTPGVGRTGRLRSDVRFAGVVVALLLFGGVCAKAMSPMWTVLWEVDHPGVRVNRRECPWKLKAWHSAQRSLYGEKDFYEPVFAKTDFTLEPRNRYTYFAAKGPVALRESEPFTGMETATVIGVDNHHLQRMGRPPMWMVTVDQLPPEVQAVLGLKGTCPKCQITAACAANLDDDSTLDLWVVSSGPLPFKDTHGNPARPGEPLHLVADDDD